VARLAAIISGVEQTDQGSFVVSVEEMNVLRQGLFVTLNHGDALIRDHLRTITGYELDEYRQLMWDIDELSGHNAGNRLLLESQLRELAALTAAERDGHSPTVREVVEVADKYGVDVPLALRDAAIDSAE
jgi:hypothetical protein